MNESRLGESNLFVVPREITERLDAILAQKRGYAYRLGTLVFDLKNVRSQEEVLSALEKAKVAGIISYKQYRKILGIPELSDQEISNLAFTACESGKYEESIAYVEEIEDNDFRTKTLFDLIRVLVEKENYNEARRFAKYIDDKKKNDEAITFINAAQR